MKDPSLSVQDDRGTEQANSISAKEYYQESLTSDIHMYLTIPEYKHDPKKLKNQLLISDERLDEELTLLKKLGLVKFNSGKVIDVISSLHLEESSPLSFRNHINWRLRAIQMLEQRHKRDNEYHLSVAFTSDIEAQLEIKQKLRDAVLEIRKIVENCNQPQKVGHLLMDFF